jgi:hypothetical protein
MNSFLITYKPATENRKRGWPIEELRKLVRKHQIGEKAIEPWRFKCVIARGSARKTELDSQLVLSGTVFLRA